MAIRYLPSASVSTTSIPFETATPGTPGSESWYRPSLLRSSNTTPRAVSAAGASVATDSTATKVVPISVRDFIIVPRLGWSPPDHGDAGGFHHSFRTIG